MESRRLFTGGPATPNLSAALSTSDPQHSIVLTYSTTDGAHLELEEMAPGDDNYHVIADLGSPSAYTTETDTLTSLSVASYYSFRLRADLNGQAAYGNAALTTGDDADTGNGTFAYAAPTYVSNTQDPDNPGLDVVVTLSTGVSGATSDYVSGEQRVAPSDDPYNIENPGSAGSGFLNSDGTVQTDGMDSEPGYNVQVRYALFGADGGQISPYSAWQTITIDGECLAAPTGLTATPAGGGNVNLSWTASAGDSNADPLGGYTLDGVDASGNAVGVGSVDGDTTTATVAGSDDSGAFVKYYIIANPEYGGVGDSHYSNFAKNPGLTPTAPQNLSATSYSDISGHGIYLLWDDMSDDETSFTIQRSTNSSFSANLETYSVAEDTTSYTDASVTTGVTYYYRVQATDGANFSSYTAAASATA